MEKETPKKEVAKKLNLIEKLVYIQSELKAPKGQRNAFGNYNYRSCEDILEAVKSLLKETKTILTIQDAIVNIEGRFYLEATVTIFDSESDKNISNIAYAREEETKKGMDASQITGSASSYARKYALNGLLCIDDTKDADATNKHEKEIKKEAMATNKQIEMINNLDLEIDKVLEYYKIKKLEELTLQQASEIIAKKKGNK